ncbi:MAG TPA: pyridoxal 5'-phosphate synthase glutaminase subunit PdxT [Thermaerobacter sp.]
MDGLDRGEAAWGPPGDGVASRWASAGDAGANGAWGSGGRLPGEPVTWPQEGDEPAGVRRAPSGGPCIGVLALQGGVAEHVAYFRRAGARVRPVRVPGDLEGLEGLVLPGGESTTLGRLMERAGLLEALAQRGRAGAMAFFGTCAGLILLARDVAGGAVPRLGLMDVVVARNAYGRQVDSFEADLAAPALGEEPLRALFIRAPVVESVGPGIQVLARWQGRPVLVRQGRCLASTFHPELSGDLRVARLFLDMVAQGPAVAV